MGHSPKIKSQTRANPKAKQRNYHLLVDPWCSSHMFTLTSWWSSQKREPHRWNTQQTNRRVSKSRK